MISKLRFSLIAIVMLVLLGFGFQNQAKGQVGLDGLFCPAVPNTTGWLETEIVGSGLVIPDFRGGLLGTVENSGADAVGGLDWQHVDNTFSNNLPPGAIGSITPTNATGSQLVTWWTQKDGRNTYLQVTNADSEPITVHVRIHNEACAEIRDFCDTYTGYDTHEYNLGDLVSNGGAVIPDNNLQGVEGWLVVTAVAPGTCASPDEQAYDHNYLAGNLIIHDSDDYLYGVNTYARQAICENVDSMITVNRVANGSFLDNLTSWNTPQQTVALTDGFAVNPQVFAPPNNQGSGNMAFVIANAANAQTYGGGSTPALNTITDFVDLGGADGSVALLESSIITVGPNDSQVLTYNLQHYAQNTVCSNWTAVVLVNQAGGGSIVDANCYQSDDTNTIGNTSNLVGNTNCQQLAVDDSMPSFGPNGWFGRSNFLTGQTLNTGGQGTFRVQVVAGQNVAGGVGACITSDEPVGALVNGFNLNGQDTITASCDGRLNGDFNALLDRVDPTVLSGQFNILPGNVQAGADAVLINFADNYGPPYRPVAANSVYFISIFDEDEQDVSCGDLTACFARLGIDDALIPSEQFSPATPTPTPTVTPTITPTPTVPPTLAPTPTPNNGGSGSCAIAGSPVQLGTALANVLIPLVPVAFAFGVRAVRRRKK